MSDFEKPYSGGDGSPRAQPPTPPLAPQQGGLLAVPKGPSRGNSLDKSLFDGGDTLFSPSSADSPRIYEKNEEEDPLKPYPGTEADFQVDNNVFAFSPGHLSKLNTPKNIAALRALGGIEGLAIGLRTDLKAGLSLDETTLEGTVSFADATGGADKFAVPPDLSVPKRANTVGAKPATARLHPDSYKDRLRVFGDNRLPERKSQSLLRLMWITLNDKVLLLLSGAAAISLALGLFQTFGVEHDPNEGAPVDWVEGVAIMVAIAIVVIVGAGNDYQKERQFVKLNKKKEDRTVKVIRSGKSLEISVFDLQVGDVCHLEPGDLIPADGIFITGHNIKCDESSATGESDQMKKMPAIDAVAQYSAGGGDIHKLDPFIISGSKVLEGVGTYVVTGVGVHSSFGKTMMGSREESDDTPLQRKLNDLAEAIAKLGGASALLLFIVLFIRFLVNLRGTTETPSEIGQSFMKILITAITVVVVAVPEGLPLAVTLALAYATTRMLKDNNLVRVLQSCETMGNATTVCSDKTGTLTQNKMTVVAGTVCGTQRFGDARKVEAGDAPEGKEAETAAQQSSIAEFISTLPENIKELLLQSIVQNSTAFEGEEDGKPTFIGSKTETAMLIFARDYLGLTTVSEARANANIAQMIPFDSARKCMGVVVKLENGQFRLMVKGASEIVLGKCSRILTLDGVDAEMTPKIQGDVGETISTYASRSLRTIGLLYRDFPAWPPAGARPLEGDASQAEFDDVFRDMTWIGIVGIQDPLRPGVRDAVLQCQKAGVFVRMVTGDNVMTARAIAEECGIYTSGGLVMEGPKFRQLTRAQMDKVIPRLQVLARSSPEDKRILVRRLKERGETVAVTGDGTNDGPALKMADVGFSMGIAGTEVAKEASAIILMDDNFSSIVKALMWGRAVNDAVKKFLQFQLTVNITAVLLTFITAVASSTETSIMSAVQLLWVNLIMDTFAALALATDPPAPSILNRNPDPKSAPLITVNMWKMILGQSVYQLAVTFVLNFAGSRILGYANDAEGYLQLKALIFNTFVWMQIFNQYNSRRLDNKFNIFEGITRNLFFIGINIVMVGGQVMIIFVGDKAFKVTRLDGLQWAISIVLGAISLPVAVVIRLIPDAAFAKIMPEVMKRKREDPAVYVSSEDRFEWNRGIEEIRHELSFLKMVRGGRLNQLKFKQQHIKDNLSQMLRSGSKSELPEPTVEDGAVLPATAGSHRRRRSRSNSTVFAAAAMVPSIVAGSIGGWSPVEKAPSPSKEEAGNLPFSSRPKSEKQAGGSLHPGTAQGDQTAPTKPPVVLAAPNTEGPASSQQPK